MYEPCSDFRKVLWWSVSIWKRWKGGFSLLMTPLCHVDWISTCGHRCLFTSKQQIYDSAVCFFYEAQALWGWMELIICHLFCNCIWRLHSFFFLFFSFFFFQRAVMELFIPVWGLHEVFTAESTLNYVKLQQSVCSSEISWWNVSRRSADFILFFFLHCETNLSTDVALNREGSCQFGIPPLSTPLNSAIYGSTQASTLSLT